MLEIQNISLVAGDFALEDINFTVRNSSSHVLMGPTGSGKTLLLETIIGFRRPTRGEIWHNGGNITNTPVESRGISYLPQDLALFPHLSVKENIQYSLRIRRIKNTFHADLTRELIDTLHIGHLLERGIHHLSGGESQRVALARAIATGNRVLLLDEPFSALHEGMKKELWFLLGELQERHNLTLLMVTHNLEEAFTLGDRISIIIDGKIHQTGEKEMVYRYPTDIPVARFLGIRNLFQAETTGRDNLIRCEELGADLVVSSRQRNGPEQGFVVGIRAEEVTVLPDGHGPQGGSNIIQGVISEVFDKGGTKIILFRPNRSQKTIEIQVPAHSSHELHLEKGRRADILLRPDLIFTLPKDPENRQ